MSHVKYFTLICPFKSSPQSKKCHCYYIDFSEMAPCSHRQKRSMRAYGHAQRRVESSALLALVMIILSQGLLSPLTHVCRTSTGELGRNEKALSSLRVHSRPGVPANRLEGTVNGTYLSMTVLSFWDAFKWAAQCSRLKSELMFGRTHWATEEKASHCCHATALQL